MFHALKVELLKLKHSRIVWVSFLSFAIAPVMGGVFIMLLKYPENGSGAATLYAKSGAMGFSADWRAYLTLLTQAIGVGGILIFGFLVSWIFGREYSEHTAKDLLSLPTSRSTILNAKFLVYVVWSFALATCNLIMAYIIGLLLHLPPLERNAVLLLLSTYVKTTALTLLPGTPVALLALWGKGYLAPLGFVALSLVLAQIIAATGFGNYFPWSIPGIFGGAAGELKAQLNTASYLILAFLAGAGYLATMAYWKYSDQVK